MGNQLTVNFQVRSTFFPFGKEYISTSLFSEGTYDETTHTFKTGQYGQMGWEYQNGADMSGYKYLVIKLKQATSGAHLNIFTENSIWSDNHETAAFGSKKQIVVNLSTAKYTSSGKKGQPLDTKNIRIVSFWADRATIVVDDMYLTNNDDYSRQDATAIRALDNRINPLSDDCYDLQGRKWKNGQLRKGIYIQNGKKIVHE